ncbi:MULTISPECIES: MobA protein [unclassified Dysgonomonas]|uniref:plasmid mobilization protein n=1 Tax=unclassified Dysgonomonas TaxID=2630389 RepID=UPI00247615B5|nr:MULTISPECIES: MobA protein [unclassified Dysgonomonas]
MEHITTGEQAPKRKRGRPKKDDILKYRYMIRLTDKENERFLSMFQQSGQKSKSKFIADCVLNHRLKVIEVNKSAIDFVIQLTQFFAQFRVIKNNYNQLFVALIRNSGEDKARFMMKILDKSTLEFIQTMKDFEKMATKLREQISDF